MVSGRLAEKNGRYHMILNLKDERGKRKEKWQSTGLLIKGNKKKAEDMLLEARRAHVDEVETKDDSKMLFPDYIEKVWLPSKRNFIEQITYAEYEREVKVIAEYFRPRQIKLKEVSIKHIEDFYDHLRITLSECSIQKYHTKIHGALKKAAKQGVIAGNPAASVEKPKPEKYNALYCNEDEMLKILEVVKGTKLELATILGFYGFRRSEVVGLKWSAVNFEKNLISISFTVTQYNRNGKRVIEDKPRAKNETSRRTLPMIPVLRNKLLELREAKKKWQKLCGNSYIKDYLEFVYVDELGDRIKPDYITQSFDTLMGKNSFREFRFHDLRHSCAGFLLANGMSMKEVQDWLGHSTFKITADTYAHLDFKSKLNSADALSVGTAFAKIPQ